MINLIPPDHREEIHFGRKNTKTRAWLATLVFGIVALFVAAIVGRLTIQTAKNQTVSQLEAIQSQIDESNLDGIEKEYGTFVDGISGVKKIYQKQILYSRLIRKLATLLPPDTSLTTISLSDKDRAINLNFNNKRDGLGPTIQINLENQGVQIAERSRTLIEDAFGVPLGGSLSESGVPEMNIDIANRQLDYYVNINSDKKLDVLQRALTNGGEFAYQLVEPSLKNQGYFDDNSSQSIPKFLSYTVDNDSKLVDFYFSANSIDEARLVEKQISATPYGAFIETYVFEDDTYPMQDKCTDKQTNKKTCELSCPRSESECLASKKICVPLKNRGCHYVVRGYYDELYSTSTITPVSSDEKKICESQASLKCTHKISAKYAQLFDKVDINRVATCITDPTNGTISCPVELRAEFGSNAKFYLINSSGATR